MKERRTATAFLARRGSRFKMARNAGLLLDTEIAPTCHRFAAILAVNRRLD
jgi:hypothetical protein